MKNFFSFVLLAVTAWFYYISTIKMNNYPLYMDKEFKPYIVKFNSELNARGKFYDLVQLEISFGSLGGPMASCYHRVQYLKVIKVDKIWWKKLTLEEKEATIFHELGHCILKKIQHQEAIFEDGCPRSLMHSSHSLKGCYFKNRSKYLDELFQN